MPVTPYQAKILEGAQAYSAPFGTPWGAAQVGLVVTVGSEWLGFGRVDIPVWPRNGKIYWVKLQYLQEYVVTPPTVEEYILHVRGDEVRRFIPE